MVGLLPGLVCPRTARGANTPLTLDDHSKVVPRLPIPNRIVKRLRADDSGRTSVKVGHRQALIPKTPSDITSGGVLLLGKRITFGGDRLFYGLKVGCRTHSEAVPGRVLSGFLLCVALIMGAPSGIARVFQNNA